MVQIPKFLYFFAARFSLDGQYSGKVVDTDSLPGLLDELRSMVALNTTQIIVANAGVQDSFLFKLSDCNPETGKRKFLGSNGYLYRCFFFLFFLLFSSPL